MALQWTGQKEFFLAQAQVGVILCIAYIGNTVPPSYPRNDNHDPRMFWVVNVGMLIAALATLKHKKNPRGAQLLSRAQTEEWKGWMQWAFIMYHYYRVYYVYNEIRVFVSAYVWMTGFGNFLYFDKTKDYSIERAVSMWLRINYFPLLLSTFLNVDLELYYVVPLHTTGFFITMVTCYIGHILEEKKGWNYWNSRSAAVALCFIVHIVFYETALKNCLSFFSDEYLFRFSSDKYSAAVGILSGLMWKHLKQYMQWAFGGAEDNKTAMWAQRAVGISLIAFWYSSFGFIDDKYIYNPIHPFVFWLPVAGWLMIRNSSRYLTEIHSTFLEFLGRITLETYVLQFHVFMTQNVQFIPILIPGSDSDGPLILKTLNMLLCGSIFVPLALWARTVTVTTQTTVVELMQILSKKKSGSKEGAITNGENGHNIETEKFIKDSDDTLNKVENGNDTDQAIDNASPQSQS